MCVDQGESGKRGSGEGTSMYGSRCGTEGVCMCSRSAGEGSEDECTDRAGFERGDATDSGHEVR